ncbi:MAG: hypothetical protein WCK67_04030 [bacterium]
MITHNHIIIAIFIEVAVFYLIIYSIFKASKWVQEKQELVDELLYEMPYKMIEFRKNLSVLNDEIDDKFKIKPLDSQELGYLAGVIVSAIIKWKFKGGGLIKNKFVVFSLVSKLWNYRKRIMTTIINSL